jgi:hypothetical protein
VVLVAVGWEVELHEDAGDGLFHGADGDDQGSGRWRCWSKALQAATITRPWWRYSSAHPALTERIRSSPGPTDRIEI